MWIVGTIILLAIGIAAVVAIGWTPRATPSPPLWDLPSLSPTYTGIVGTIGGFAVASAIFIAGFDVTRASPLFATVVGMLLIAFLILVLCALLYASIPNAPQTDDGTTQALSHALANMNGCLGLSISWLALVPLLEMMGLPALAGAFIWLLLYVAVAQSGWVAVFAYRLTLASVAACLAIPVLGFGLAALYRLVAARIWPDLWPATDAALRMSFVAFVVAAAMFATHTNLLLMDGNPKAQPRLRQNGHRIVLALSEAHSLVVALSWFAVAMP
jgi:hypothetical protein